MRLKLGGEDATSIPSGDSGYSREFDSDTRPARMSAWRVWRIVPW